MSEPESRRVVLYVTPTCPYCRQVYDFLMRREVAFEVYDVSQDPDALREMARRSGQHDVPVLTVDDRVFVGWDLERLDQLFPRTRVRGIRLGISIANAKPAGGSPAGAYVGRVDTDTPADRGGVQRGDIVIEMAQQPVRGANDVHAIASEIIPGSSVPLTIWRAGRKFRIVLRT